MGASLLMSSFLATARVLYDACTDLADLAKRLCSIMHRSTEAGHFVTGFVGCLDPATGTLEYVNAGHPSPCLVLGDEVRELESTGIPFGILPDFPYASATVTLRPGELLVTFSDGVPEAQCGDDFFDFERLHQSLRQSARLEPLQAVRQALVKCVEEFVADSPRSDDITILMLRRGRDAA
jgi:sigma-B regulation protein RsbU (phosphoserine phosphatase)